MGKQDILEVLKNNKDRWMTSKEIAEELEKRKDIKNVAQPLAKLRKANDVLFKEKGVGPHGEPIAGSKLIKYLYKYK